MLYTCKEVQVSFPQPSCSATASSSTARRYSVIKVYNYILEGRGGGLNLK